MSVPTKEWAERLFDYDPATGVLCLRRVKGRRGQRGTGTGRDDGQGYLRIYVEGTQYRAHNIAWLLLTGRWEAVDHINLNRSDNRASNLRAATKSQNSANTLARSGVKGVSVCKATGKWRADIQFQGKRFNLGRYPTLELAKAAYDAKALELFGEYARL